MANEKTESTMNPAPEDNLLDTPLPGDDLPEDLDGNEEVSSEEPKEKPVAEETKEDEPAEDSEDEVSEEKQPKKKLSGNARRRRRLIAERDALRAENARLKVASQPTKQDPVDNGPNPDDYEHGINDINFIDARTEWRVEQGIKKGLQDMQQHSQQQKIQEKIDTAKEKARVNFEKKMDVALNKYPDLEDRIESSGIYFDNEAVKHVIRSASNVGEMMNYFADNPEEAENLNTMMPIDAALRVGELNKELTPSKTKQPVSKMPKPVSTLKGNVKTKKPKALDESWGAEEPTLDEFLENTSIHDLDNL